MYDPLLKNWWLSKTNWVGMLSLLIAILAILPGHSAIIPADWLPYIMFVQAVLVLVLRYITDQPLNSPMQGLSKMKLWSLLFLLFALAAPLASAEEVAILVDSAKPGNYLLTVEANGAITVNPIRVVRPGQAPTNPTDPTNPPAGPTEFSKQVQRMTAGVLSSGGSPTTAAALSSVYALVSKGVSSGSIPEANAFGALKAATDTVLNNVPDSAKWQQWRSDLGLALETLRQTGVLKLPSAFDEVATGINAALGKDIDPTKLVGMSQAEAAAAKPIFENIDLAKLIELIMAILKLFEIFKPMN
jgi:hypothetical protein